MASKSLSEKKVLELAKRYHTSDATLREIAFEVGVAPSTLSRWFRKAGIKMKSKGTSAGHKRPSPVVNSLEEANEQAKEKLKVILERPEKVIQKNPVEEKLTKPKRRIWNV